MDTLETALDAASYEWLVSNLPDVAQAIEVEVAAGSTPSQIKTVVLRHTGRLELALRCEQAARWLVGEDG
jgi:hypothetical protein